MDIASRVVLVLLYTKVRSCTDIITQELGFHSPTSPLPRFPPKKLLKLQNSVSSLYFVILATRVLCPFWVTKQFQAFLNVLFRYVFTNGYHYLTAGKNKPAMQLDTNNTCTW